MSLLDALNVFPAGIMIMEGAGRDAREFQQLSELSHGFATFVMPNHAWATIEDFLGQGATAAGVCPCLMMGHVIRTATDDRGVW